MADALKYEPGVQVEVEDGGKGEFTVLVAGQEVRGPEGAMPTVNYIRTAVREAAHQPLGTGG